MEQTTKSTDNQWLSVEHNSPSLPSTPPTKGAVEIMAASGI
jgi:hypothetical protein